MKPAIGYWQQTIFSDLLNKQRKNLQIEIKRYVRTSNNYFIYLFIFKQPAFLPSFRGDHTRNKYK